MISGHGTSKPRSKRRSLAPTTPSRSRRHRPDLLTLRNALQHVVLVAKRAPQTGGARPSMRSSARARRSARDRAPRKGRPTRSRVLITGQNGTGKTGGAGDPRAQPPRRGPSSSQLRGHPVGADRERAVRTCEGEASPAPSRIARASSSGRRRHPVLDEIGDMSLRRRPRCCGAAGRSHLAVGWARPDGGCAP